MKKSLGAMAAMAMVGTQACAAPAWGAATAGASSTAALRKIANEVNLTAKDLPGWKQTPNTPSASDQATSDKIAQCAGANPPSKVTIVDVDSPYFDQGGDELSSDVTFVRTREDGTSDLKAMTGTKLVPCLKSFMVPYLQHNLPAGAKLSGFQIKVYHPSWSPPSSFGYRMDLQLSATPKGSTTVSLHLDVIGFLVGRAEVELTDSSEGSAPSRPLEQRLVTLMAARADKYASST